MTEIVRKGRIALLPELVRNQIAAGEVIERPASVVKELVENSLDAGASRVAIDLEQGGVQLVRVVDDGCGIAAGEVELAFAAHATSKLSEVSDLDHIATLGFRGEALASIASVARCTLFSRTRESALGARIEVEGGEIEGGEPRPAREMGGAVGTRIEVRDLFFNTPARRRFLRTTATELGRCLDVIQRLALAQIGVGFVATHDGRRLFEVEPAMDLRARVRRTFGAELAAALVDASGADGDTRFEALLAPPRLARNDATRQMWFLNGRPVRDKVLLRVLREAYRGLIPDGRQPVAFVSLSIDPAKVDVNVHPAKSEVRFRDEKRLFGFLVARLRDALRATDMATPGERLIELAGRRDAGGTLHPGQRELVLPRAGAPYAPPVELPATPQPQLVRETPQPNALRADPDPLRGPFLQIAKTYIVRALPEGFEIVDQHALHERLTLELLREELERGRVEVQRRLVPDQVEVGPASVELLEPHFESLERIGFLLSRFGAGTVAVHGLPARLRKPDPEALVREIVAAIESSGDAPKADELMEHILHRAACRSSVMAGDELSEIEMRALLARARDTSHDQTCAHGRPTRVQFTLADLEKAFHRR